MALFTKKDRAFLDQVQRSLGLYYCGDFSGHHAYKEAEGTRLHCLSKTCEGLAISIQKIRKERDILLEYLGLEFHTVPLKPEELEVRKIKK